METAFINNESNKKHGELSDLKGEVRNDIDKYIIPFFEKLHLASQVPYQLLSIVPGLLCFVLHFSVSLFYGVNIFKDRSFILAIMISVCTFLLFSASGSLKRFVINLIELSDIEIEEYHQKYILTLNKISQFKLLKYGIPFGILNMMLGIIFGQWYIEPALNVSLAFQHFFVGVLCGSAIGGIVVVVQLISKIGSQAELNIDYLSPDKCGGTLMIGKLVFNFAIYTLVMGVFIAFYIYVSPWENKGKSWFIDLLINSWTVFPFFASLIIFIVPVLKFHTILKRYKADELSKIYFNIKELSNAILQVDITKPEGLNQLTVLKSKYELYRHFDDYCHRMNTWPYDFTLSISYLISLLLPIIITIISKLLSLYS